MKNIIDLFLSTDADLARILYPQKKRFRTPEQSLKCGKTAGNDAKKAAHYFGGRSVFSSELILSL